MEISRMTLADLELIANNLKKDFDDFWTVNILKSELENINNIYIVCKKDSEILGFAGISITLDTSELNNIVVKKTFRGKGISSLLMESTINASINSNCTAINLEVSAKNIVAINLYKKFGFEQVGCRKKYYNNSTDALLFTKKLRS